jgi:arginine utilization protein RocB
MCLNCGCMEAHDDMGKAGVNFTYEDLKRAAAANAMTVDATLAMIGQTSDKDRAVHPEEYSAQMVSDLSRLDDDGGPSVVHD